MSRERSRRSQQLRRRIAHLAARIMAEDGIEEYGAAKRKAAHQAGADDLRELPSNDEIEAELRAYYRTYRAAEHENRLQGLRAKALQAMRELARFDPVLAGSVLTGVAGKYAEIHLFLFAEGVKEVELFLLSGGVAYRCRERRMFVGDGPRTIAGFTLLGEEAEIHLWVFSAKDRHRGIRLTAEGKPMGWAKLAEVESLLNEGETQATGAPHAASGPRPGRSS